MATRRLARLTLTVLMLGLAFATSSAARPQETKARKEVFGKTSSGETVELYSLKNSQGMEARVITYGGIIV